MRLERACWALGIAVALGASGCIVDVVFDPVGSDASVEGSWLVESAAPTAESCAALGISRVRVRFYDGSRTFDHASLVFPCEQGSFDTRPDAVLGDGVWTMQLLAIDAAGNVVAEGQRETFDTIAEGGHIVMTRMDFIAGPTVTQVTGRWTIDGATPDATSCAALGIAQVGIDFMDGNSPVAAACAAGSIAAQVDPGTYTVQIVAIDAGGAVISMAMEETFTVAEGTSHALNAGGVIDFMGAGFDPRGADAAIDAAWTVGRTAASAEACEIAGGTTVELAFYDVTDTARAEGVVVAMAPCGDGAFTSSGNVLAAGTYLISAILRDAAAAEVGRADFDQATVAASDTLDLTATDLRLAHTTISFGIEWEMSGGGGTYTGCSAAGVTGIRWDLGRADPGTTMFDTLYASPTSMEACEDRFTFSTATSEPVTPGEYDLLVEGYDGARKAWDLTAACAVTVTEEGDLAIVSMSESCKLAWVAP